jgi:hypothetical protein
MKKLIYLILAATVMFSCNNQNENDEQKSSKEEKEIKKITLEEFFENSYEKQILEFDKFERKDTTYENMYDPDKRDTISTFSFKESKLVKYKDFILNIDIENNELIEDYFFEIGMSKDRFKEHIKGFEEKCTDDITEGPVIKKRDNKIVLSESIEEFTTWSFIFEDDKLLSIHYEIYID